MPWKGHLTSCLSFVIKINHTRIAFAQSQNECILISFCGCDNSAFVERDGNVVQKIERARESDHSDHAVLPETGVKICHAVSNR